MLLSVTLVVALFMVQWLFDDFGESAPAYVYATLILISASALSATIKVVFTTFLDNMQKSRDVKVEGSNPLLVFLARGTVWAIGIVLAAEQLSINLSGVLASLAVFSIIIGLAVQHTLGNIMNSFMLSLDRPFDNGDRIVVDGIEGTVMTWACSPPRSSPSRKNWSSSPTTPSSTPPSPTWPVAVAMVFHAVWS